MEMAVIAIIALIVLGPNKLPEAAKSLGKGFREMRDSFQGAVGSDDDELAFGRHEDDEDEEDGDLDHHGDASEDFDPSDAVAQQDEKAEGLKPNASDSVGTSSASDKASESDQAPSTTSDTPAPASGPAERS